MEAGNGMVQDRNKEFSVLKEAKPLLLLDLKRRGERILDPSVDEAHENWETTASADETYLTSLNDTLNEE